MARLPDPARSRAVLIGTSDYADPELLPLPAVRNNLADLRAVLRSQTGLPHCVELLNPPDAATIAERLAAAAAEAEDLLLVYYAGHGLIGSDHELYLALPNTKQAIVGSSAMRCKELRQAFLDCAARNRVLIVDSCFSGRAFEQTMSTAADALLGDVDVQGAFVLTATEPNKPASAPAGARNTLFTGELLRVLREGIPGGPELLTLDLLYRQLRASLGRRNLPRPTCNNNDTVAHLALASNPAHRPPPPAGDIAKLKQQLDELQAVARDFASRLATLSKAVDELARAETETAYVYQTVFDKIAQPGLPPAKVHAPKLRITLDVLELLARNGEWAQVADKFAQLSRETAEALEGTRRLRAAAEGLLDRRTELRGRLKVLLAMAVRLGVAENELTEKRYTSAYNILWTKPCDLGEATRAVLAYQQSVIDGRETG